MCADGSYWRVMREIEFNLGQIHSLPVNPEQCKSFKTLSSIFERFFQILNFWRENFIFIPIEEFFNQNLA